MAIRSAFKRSMSLPQIHSPFHSKSYNVQSPFHVKSYHVRSSSLPCSSYPALARVRDAIGHVKEWMITSKVDRTAKNLCKGLDLLKSLYHSTDDLLQSNRANEVVRSNKQWANSMLEDLVHFLDIFSTVLISLSGLKEHQFMAQHSLRRRKGDRDVAKVLINYQCKNMNKEMLKMLIALKTLMSKTLPNKNNEFLTIFTDVRSITASVAISLISCLCWSRKGIMDKWMGMRRTRMEGVKEISDVYGIMDNVLRSRGGIDDEVVKVVLKRMMVLEESIEGLDRRCDSIFRSLLNARVAILNILT